jgi:dolichyl-phosphate-mannose--protein O-mannosyl transferase
LNIFNLSAYGDKLINDVYDYWTLIVLDDNNRHSKDMNITWQTLNQRFRLLHIRGCALISHGAYYGGEGHNHQEVTCMASAGLHVSTWIVESAYHEKCMSASRKEKTYRTNTFIFPQ